MENYYQKIFMNKKFIFFEFEWRIIKKKKLLSFVNFLQVIKLSITKLSFIASLPNP